MKKTFAGRMPMWRLGLSGLILVCLSSAVARAGGQPAYSVYLPVMLDRPCPPPGPVIFGCLELNGARAGGVAVTLTRVYNLNPKPSETAGTAISDANGYFQFDNIPPVTGPDYYFAGYRNPSNPAQLGDRDQPFTYTGGQQDLGIWDLTNIQMGQPADSLHVTLPYTFTWSLRPTSPSDYYVLVIYGQSGSFDYFQQGVGYHTAQRLDGLPTDLHYGQEYLWLVRNQPAFPFEPIIEDAFQPRRVTFDSP